MKHGLKIVLLFLLPVFTSGQQAVPDSLRNLFNNATSDSVRYEAAWNQYNYYEELSRDSALHYAETILSLAQKNNKKLPEILGLDFKAYQLLNLGRYAASLQCLLQAFKLAEDPASGEVDDWLLSRTPSPGQSRLLMLSLTHHMFAILMWQTQNTGEQIVHFKEARRIGKEINNPLRLMLADMNLGNSYVILNKPDSALLYEKEAEELVQQSTRKKYGGYVFSVLGEIYMIKGDSDRAREYFYRGVEASSAQKNLSSLSRNYLRLARYYIAENNKDSALYYALNHLHTVQSLGRILGIESNLGAAYANVYIGYKLQGQFDSAFKYQGLALTATDSLSKVRMKNLADFQNLGFREQLRLQDLANEKKIYQNKVRIYFLLAGIGVLLLLAIIFYRNNRQKQKARKRIEEAYHDLKATQAQLIQSEKMASLGELTAGIAHEIQNPLNFVNNFSEINAELVDELKVELDKGNTLEATEIANSLKDNEEKINYHGKRADAIVKGMLQHSRTSSGQKELTDINALCDEYLRLSYHGLRAKDKSFNAKFETDFDNNAGKINIVPQDLGRVILNLINNAFYAVNEKKHAPASAALAGYEPTVKVTTSKKNGKVEIAVNDNGNGVPQKVIDKIFQPFFTTKPTGQGTGLGLSLSYDIVTKGHGGELKVETKEGVGSTFIIILPVSQ